MQLAVRLEGPIFDQRYEHAIEEFLDAATQDVAETGLAMMAATSAMFRYESHPPTHQWSRNLAARQRSARDITIEDPVSYNAWLEGVGSRNARSRFKGYRMWRLTRQQIQRIAPHIAARTLRQYIGRLGG